MQSTFNVHAGEFVSALKDVRSVIGRRERVPEVLRNVKFVLDESGALTLSARNTTWGIEKRIEAILLNTSKARDIEISTDDLRPARFAAFKKKEPLVVAITEDEEGERSIILSQGRVRHSFEAAEVQMGALTAQTGSGVLAEHGSRFVVPARTWRTVVDFVKPCAAQDDSRPVLNSVRVELSNVGIGAVAADGFRLANIEAVLMPRDDRDRTEVVLLPIAAVAASSSMLTDEIVVNIIHNASVSNYVPERIDRYKIGAIPGGYRYKIGEAPGDYEWITKIPGGGRWSLLGWKRKAGLVTKVVLSDIEARTTIWALSDEGKYPDYESIIPTKFDYVAVAPINEFEDGVNFVLPFAKESGNKMTLRDLRNGTRYLKYSKTASIYAESQEKGDLTSELNIQVVLDTGKMSSEFSINATYVKDMLRAMSKTGGPRYEKIGIGAKEVQIGLNDARSPVVFTPTTLPDFVKEARWVVMPMVTRAG